jgi:DNA-binding PadR family transcriptional regulator
MSLRHAILTALIEKPSSGLALTRRFDRSIGYFWQASHQQVYRELGKLEREGLVRSVPQPPSRGNRKHFEVTPEGRSELVSWVATEEAPRPVRDPLLVRLRAASVVGPGSLVDQMRAHREAHVRRRDEYLEIAERDFGQEELSDVARTQYLILRAGIGLEEHWIAWLDEAIPVLKDLPQGIPEP